MWRVVLLLLPFLFFSPVASAEEKDPDWLYEVKVTDTIWDICKSYVSDNQCWRKLVEYNQVKTPKYLPPGTVLKIPRSWLKPALAQALVIAVEGEVSVSRENQPDETMLAIGDKLNRSDVVTARNGSAMIQFADDSRLLLKPNSSVRMEGLRYYQRGGIADTQIRLLKGRVKASVEKLRGAGSRFDITTPAAVAAVRGTEFRVGLGTEDGKAVMLTELLEGGLNLENDQGEQTLSSGEGLRAIEGEVLPEPVKLLPRPRLDFSASKEITLPHQLRWFAVEGAQKYRVSLRKNTVLLWEMETFDPEFELDLPQDGEYEVQISAVDQFGFEGQARRLKMATATDI